MEMLLLHPEVELDHQSPIGRGVQVACQARSLTRGAAQGAALQPIQPSPWHMSGHGGGGMEDGDRWAT